MLANGLGLLGFTWVSNRFLKFIINILLFFFLKQYRKQVQHVQNWRL